MLSLDTLTENQVTPYFTSSAWKKAVAMQGQVYQPTRAGNTLRARVQGGMLYDVEVTVADDGITGDCTCPFEGGGPCKHAAGLLVRWLRARRSFKTEEVAATPASIPPLAVKPAPEPTLAYAPPAWIDRPADARAQQAFEELCTKLEQMTVATMRAIASERGWVLRGTQKAAIVEQFAQYMIDAQQIEAGLALLGAT